MNETTATTTPVVETRHNVFEFQKGELYTHPSLRDLSQDGLRERLNRIRNRRLVAAIEFRSKQHTRLDSEGSKLSDQWNKLRDSLSTKLAQWEEAADKIDEGLQKLEKISNQMKLLEG